MFDPMMQAPRRAVSERPSGRSAWTLQGFVVLLLIWLVLDGPEDWMVGVLVAAIGAALTGWLGRVSTFWWIPWRVPGFFAFFVFESLRGGLDVAWRSLHPRLPVQPQFFEYEIALPQGQPSTLLISVITLLPGTLSAELRRDEHMLVVHALNPGAAASVPRLERRIAMLYGLDRQPRPEGSGPKDLKEPRP